VVRVRLEDAAKRVREIIESDRYGQHAEDLALPLVVHCGSAELTGLS
jgi:hypothetical protein